MYKITDYKKLITFVETEEQAKYLCDNYNEKLTIHLDNSFKYNSYPDKEYQWDYSYMDITTDLDGFINKQTENFNLDKDDALINQVTKCYNGTKEFFIKTDEFISSYSDGNWIYLLDYVVYISTKTNIIYFIISETRTSDKFVVLINDAKNLTKWELYVTDIFDSKKDAIEFVTNDENKYIELGIKIDDGFLVRV